MERTKDLTDLLKESDCFSQTLNRLRQDLLQPDQSNKFSSDHIQEAINLRNGLRNLADGIEARRMIAQLQKQRIERSKNHLEGLNYYKTTLQKSIESASLSALDLSEYLETPLGEVNWVETYAESDNHLKLELKSKQEKKLLLEAKIAEKQQKEAEYRAKVDLFEKVIPAQVTRLFDQVVQISKIFPVVETETLEFAQNVHLSGIMDFFMPLKNAHKLEMTYSKGQFEELQIVIKKTDHQLYTQANMNKLPLVEKSITFSIVSLDPHFDKLVIGIDRKNQFRTEEVFSRLFLSEQPKTVFASPKNEIERNISNRFVWFEWLESLLSSKRIEASLFLETLRQRWFSLLLIQYIVDNFKRIPFFFSLREQISVSDINKISVRSIEKIRFEEYKSLKHLPPWMEKYQNNYQILWQMNKVKPLSAQQNLETNRHAIDTLINQFHVEELRTTGLNSYHKVIIGCQKMTLTCVIIVPVDYPKSPSAIQIINYFEGDHPSTLEIGLPCKFQVARLSNKMFTKDVWTLENCVNEGLKEVCPKEWNPSFTLLLQVNYLLTLLIMHK